jgi:hypothetical protein
MFVGLSYQETIGIIQKMEKEHVEKLKNPSPSVDVSYYRNGLFVLRELRKRIREQTIKKYSNDRN